MKILDLIETDSVNYKKICMTVMFPYCTFKCNKEAGRVVCQNYEFKDIKPIEINTDELIDIYLANPLSEALVLQGLEPFDSFDELSYLVSEFSGACNDDIVIYTGYNKDEIADKINLLLELIKGNELIIKFGRYLPDDESRFDEVLGVTLASSNQYAEVVKSKGDLNA